MTRRILHWEKISLATAIAASISGSAHAQTSAAGSSPAAASDEIIVTANRREERAQDVGISVSALNPEALLSKNIRSAEDLAKTIPGLNATASTGSGVSTIVIRGVGVSDFSDHQEQPNATYQDGVYIPFSTAVGIPIFDIQRAEVLRGPQGTLFGRNATGGLIQYISNRPKLGLSGSLEGAVGERDLRRVQGFINAGNDIIQGRLSAYYQKQNGVIENVSGPDRGNKEVKAIRAQIQITPDALTVINFRAEGFNQDGTAPGYVGRPSYYPGGGPYGAYLPANVDAWGTGPGNDIFGYRNPYDGQKVDLKGGDLLTKKSRLYSLIIERKFGGATLTSTTAFGEVENAYTEDTDSTLFNQFTAGNKTKAHDFQQDVHINGSSGGLRYTVGAFYLDVSGKYGLYNYFDAVFGGVAAPGMGGLTVRNDYRVKTNSKAIYGQVEYDLTDKFTVIAGGRYTWDDLKLDRLTVSCSQTVDGACAALAGFSVDGLNQYAVGLGPVTINNKFGDWSGKFQLNYKLASDVLLYASVNRGIKSGGFTAPLTSSFQASDFSYRPEKLLAFEVGEKAQFFNRRVTLNTSVYYYDYKDFQTFLFENLNTRVLNRTATAYGGEVELSARLGGGITGNVGVAYNHFAVHNVSTPTAPGGEDQRPINAPRLQMVWGLGKSFPVSDDLKVDLNYYGRYVGNAYYNVVNVPIVRAPSYTVHDLNLRVESKQGWWVAAYLNNVLDKRYQVGAFDVTFFGWSLAQYGEPRTFSIAAGVKF